MTIKCDCGGSFVPAKLARFDFGPFAGVPLVLTDVPGLRCRRCKAETLDGTMINFVLNLLAYFIVQLPFRLNADLARYLRKRIQLTQAALSEKMDVSRETVAKWECGDSQISPHHDYILRGLVISHYVRHRLLRLDEAMALLTSVRRDPPPAKSALPPQVVKGVVEGLRSGEKQQFKYAS